MVQCSAGLHGLQDQLSLGQLSGSEHLLLAHNVRTILADSGEDMPSYPILEGPGLGLSERMISL